MIMEAEHCGDAIKTDSAIAKGIARGVSCFTRAIEKTLNFIHPFDLAQRLFRHLLRAFEG